MFDKIKRKMQILEEIKTMSIEELFYAWKWLEEGKFNDITISDECFSELTLQCCFRLS